jgi:hypothetical protein
MREPPIKWEAAPAEKDLAAARSYLSLLFTDREVAQVLRNLKKAPLRQFEAKDLLRASQTHLLKKKNRKVRETLRDIRKGHAIAPVLLVRGAAAMGVTTTIADGHHRICASWHWDETCPIAVCLAPLPRASAPSKRRS